jgi:hypothetical protein
MMSVDKGSKSSRSEAAMLLNVSFVESLCQMRAGDFLGAPEHGGGLRPSARGHGYKA